MSDELYLFLQGDTSYCSLPQDDLPKEFYAQAAQVTEKRLAAAGSRLSEILKRA